MPATQFQGVSPTGGDIAAQMDVNTTAVAIKAAAGAGCATR